jgi:hypothetical protein
LVVTDLKIATNDEMELGLRDNFCGFDSDCRDALGRDALQCVSTDEMELSFLISTNK